MIELFAIPTEEALDYWGDVEPLLSPAIELTGGRYNIKTVYNALEKGDMQLWLIMDNDEIKSATVTQIVLYETGLRVLRFLFCGGGNAKSWLHHIESIKKWGKDLDCHKADIFGRKGWSRSLGWKQTFAVMECDL